MRKFLSSTAGATFYADTPNYAIAHLMRVADDKGLLFTDWGTYFDRIKNYPSSESRVKSHLSYAESRVIVNKVNPAVQLPQIHTK